jgi:hypothetical protein
MRNGVVVLMKEHNITADAAKMILLGVIVEQESLAAKLKKERLEKPTSKEILQYFEAIELYVGGSCYWHSTAPRYQVFQWVYIKTPSSNVDRYISYRRIDLSSAFEMERNPKPGRQMGTQNVKSQADSDFKYQILSIAGDSPWSDQFYGSLHGM